MTETRQVDRGLWLLIGGPRLALTGGCLIENSLDGGGQVPQTLSLGNYIT